MENLQVVADIPRSQKKTEVVVIPATEVIVPDGTIQTGNFVEPLELLCAFF